MSSQFKDLGDSTSVLASNRAMEGGNTGGLTLCDTLYYTKQSIAFQTDCMTYANTRFTQSFTTLQCNGAPALTIANMSFVDLITMQVKLSAGTIPANCSLPRGWLLALINRIEYQIGPGQTMTIYGKDHFQLVMELCETQDKKLQTLNLAGQAVLATNASDIFAYAPICIPISRFGYDTHKLPFDAKMLSLPIRVTVFFESGGLSTISGGTGTASLPTSFNDGRFVVRQIDFKANAKGIADYMQMDPYLSYDYPMLFVQGGQTLSITGSSSVSSPVNISLSGFRAGDIQAICFLLVKNTNISNGNNAKNPLLTEQVSDITLNFNGNIVHKMDGQAHDLVYMNNQPVPNLFPNQALSGTTSTFTATSADSYYYTLDMTQWSSVRKEGSIQSGLTVMMNTLTMSFTTPNANATACTMYIAYRYASAIRTSNKGQSVEFVY